MRYRLFIPTILLFCLFLNCVIVQANYLRSKSGIKLEISDSNDYQTVYPEVISYFTKKGNDNIVCLWVDSLYNLNDQYHLLFAHNIQQTGDGCYTPYGASWIGERVIIRDNKYNLFFNKNSDTILIKTDAKLNETWTAYNGKSAKIITAVVADQDTLSFMGQVDSVKTIAFQVYDTTMSPINHKLNSMYIKLSKKYGLIQTLNFYLFPDFQSEIFFEDRYDELDEFNLIGLSNPQIGVQNLTWMDVYDFQIGDELHVMYDYYAYGYNCSETHNSKKTIYTILSRINFDNSITYKVERKQDKHTSLVFMDSNSYEYYFDTITWVISSDSLFDILPGVPIITYNKGNPDWAYTHRMLNTDPIEKVIPSTHSTIEQWNENDTCWKYSQGFFGCWPIYSYKKGLGGPYYECTDMGVDCAGWIKNNLVYYKKGSKTWGTPLSLKLGQKKYKDQLFEIYPNPAHNFVFIRLDRYKGDYCVINIYDLSGRNILSRSVKSANKEFQVDISSLPVGYYILELNSQIRKLIKQ